MLGKRNLMLRSRASSRPRKTRPAFDIFVINVAHLYITAEILHLGLLCVVVGSFELVVTGVESDSVGTREFYNL